jgi:hypothetical protein
MHLLKSMLVCMFRPFALFVSTRINFGFVILSIALVGDAYCHNKM